MSGSGIESASIVDAHHHLWDLNEHYYPWLADKVVDRMFGDYSAIRKSYLIEDFHRDIGELAVVKTVHLQAEHDPNDPVAETRWLQAVADDPISRGVPTGIVAFADLSEPGVEQVLVEHCEFSNVRGIRQILNRHPNRLFNFAAHDYLEDGRWWQNFALLEKYQLSFDVQVYWHHMADVARLATHYAGVAFVLNHTGMPTERDPLYLGRWASAMRTLAACENVSLKISGLGMSDPHWTTQTIRPIVYEAIEIFGVGRCMFASNFPADKLWSTYRRVWEAFWELTEGMSDHERGGLFHDNAIRVYRLG